MLVRAVCETCSTIRRADCLTEKLALHFWEGSIYTRPLSYGSYAVHTWCGRVLQGTV